MSDVKQNPINRGKDPFRWVMLGLSCMFFFLFTGLAASSLAYMMPFIVAEFGFSATQAGAIMSALAIGVMIFVFIGGILLDKLSVKKVMVLAFWGSALLVLLRGFATGFYFLYAIMLIFGMIQGVYAPGVQKVVALWFDRTEVFIANGILTAASPIGMIVGLNFSYPLMLALGSWRYLFFVIGGVSMLFAFLWMFVAKDRAHTDSALTTISNTIQVTDDSQISLWENIKLVLKLRQVWILNAVEFVALGSIWATISFSPMVLQGDPNWALDPAIAGRVTSMANLGSIFGYLVIPRLSDRVGLRKAVCIPFGILSGVCYITSYLLGNFNLSLILMFIAGFGGAAMIPVAKTMVMEQPEIGGLRAGTALGVISTVQRLGIVFFTFVLSTIIDVRGLENRYTGSIAMATVHGMMILGALLLLFAKETGWKANSKGGPGKSASV